MNSIVRYTQLFYIFIFTIFPNLAVFSETWDGDTNNDWNTIGNWGIVVPNGATDDVLFTDIVGTNLSPNISSGIQVRDITFDGSVDSYILSGSGGNISFSSGSDLLNNSSVNHSISANLDLNGNNIGFGGTGTGVITLSGTITSSGSQTITKSGSSTTHISSDNDASLNDDTKWVLNAGTIQISNDNSLGKTSIVQNDYITLNGATISNITSNVSLGAYGGITLGAANGTLHTDTGRTLTMNNSIFGSGNLTKTGDGTLSLNGNNSTYTGTTIVDAGILRIRQNASLGGTGGGTTVNGVQGGSEARMTVANNATIAENITLAFDNSAGSGFDIFDAFAATGSSGETMTLTGTLTLDRSGSDSSSGIAFAVGTDSNSNLVIQGNITGAVSGSDISTKRGSRLFLKPAVGNSVDISGNISNGTLNNMAVFLDATDSTGSATLSGNNTYTGDTVVRDGILYLGHSNALGSSDVFFTESFGGSASDNPQILTNAAVSISNNFAVENKNTSGTSTLGGSSAHSSTFSGTISLTDHDLVLSAVSGGDVTFSNVISDISGTNAIIKAGAGDVTMSGANTYAGGTVVRSGVLYLENNASLGTGTVTAGDASSGSSNINILTNGALTISNNVSITNNTSGTITMGVNSSDNSTFSGALGLSDNLTITAVSGGTATFSGVISDSAGTNGITKIGAGTLVLSGNNSYDGLTTLTTGEMIINGDQSAANGHITVASGTFLSGTGNAGGSVTSLDGKMSAGSGEWSVGTFSISGSNANLSGGTFVWDISDLSAVAGIGYDLLTFTSAYDLSTNLGGGALNIYVQDNNNYIGPNGGTAGNTYEVMRGVTNFNESYFNLDSNLINTVWSTTWTDANGGTLWLSYEVVPEPSTYFMCGFIFVVITFRFFRKRRMFYIMAHKKAKNFFLSKRTSKTTRS